MSAVPAATAPSVRKNFARQKILIVTLAEEHALKEKGWNIERRGIVHDSYKDLAALPASAQQIYLSDTADKKPTHHLILKHPKLFPNLSVDSTRHVYEDSVPSLEQAPTCYSLCTQLLADLAAIREEAPKQKVQDLRTQTERPHLATHQSAPSGKQERNLSGFCG